MKMVVMNFLCYMCDFQMGLLSSHDDDDDGDDDDDEISVQPV